MRLVYRVTPTQQLIIVEHALLKMQAFTQRRWWHCEAGGVLLGRHLLDSQDVVVDEVSTPQSSDRRSRFSFFRSSTHECIARQRWLEQGSTSAYLGLWHTHPELDPTPSIIDRRDWEQAVSGDTFEGDRLFFPIIGTRSIRIWTLSRRGTFRELKLEKKIGSEENNGTG
ncbi:Mov34/MPN/PAD-1 family protein [Halopseudomonas bauzanensis]|uniref:Integrative and conjugative element protein, VC0181 family n=1 Tax=Halopseudomonas bauzanensis TaxID=653930 RepID=A0A1H9TS14_9GAMM|nr:Mov34/MPN/PAD-1 family protein [Halopseudomonas bauzanensis]SER99787.1 integrative and conjugative element protein, VC0181 family [Halopseudomonas bauzanensis]SFM01514.1 integrative and conjugative element protein, VC0181 family [Halopseudomonas bauzanensis]